MVFKYLCLNLFLLNALNTNSMCDFDKRWRSKSQELLAASEAGNNDEVHRLLCAGADVDGADKYGETPLICASIWGHTSVVKTLLNFEAKVDKVDKYGKTPLLSASEGGHTKIVKKLLKANANVDLADIHGNTPLICASISRHGPVVSILLDKGAKTYLTTTYNPLLTDSLSLKPQTALDCAEKQGHTAVADFIRPYASWEGADGNRVAWITACVIVGRQAWPTGASSASRPKLEE